MVFLPKKTTYKMSCEYPGGCPIEPLVAQQAALMAERDWFYASVRETNNRQEVDGLIARAQALDAQIKEIEGRKNRLHPCRYCIYQ